MCGIYFSCSRTHTEGPSQRLQERLNCRGPDASRTIKFGPHGEIGFLKGWHITVLSTVLSLRSDELVVQPMMSGSGSTLACNFLMWNGEAWRYDGEIVQSHDSRFVYQKLMEATVVHSIESDRLRSCKQETVQAISRVFSRISGPYAFVFFDYLHSLLFYGRDVLGRRSLLLRKSGLDGFELISVCAGLDDYEEAKHDVHGPQTVHIPWQKAGQTGGQIPSLQYPFPPFNTSTSLSDTVLNLESPEVSTLIRLLKVSLQIRLNSAPAKVSLIRSEDRVAILFSGGLDCTLLARIAHDILPYDQEIDLLNVAFENPRVVAAASKANSPGEITGTAYETCPDRITGRASHAEVSRLCPERLWQFLPIDVPFEELTAHRHEIIELLFPHNTEMDFSIGCALYFAARGQGCLGQDGSEDLKSYVTPAQVLISGLGADELFGGYSRHAVAHQHRGYQGLVDELQKDFERIAQRNLGRDDRIISHWGKEARYPFLDEAIVSWTLSIPAAQKCNFGQGVDKEGLDASKRLLRLAAWKLGLREAARQKKRAIQFGARTAKMTVGRTKGTQKIEGSV